VISQDAWNALPPDRQNELSQSVVRALDWLSDDQDTAKPIGIHWDTWRTH
jgi:TRAP-type C4-dicarboxylate transport system substrate-binding protein